MTDSIPPEKHAANARNIIAAMVKHPIHADGIPDQDVKPGFHQKMVEPIWDDIDAQFKEILTDTGKIYDVEFVIAIPALHTLRNTRSLEIYEFNPTFHKYKPVDYGVNIEFAGSYEDEHDYGFNVFLGSVDFTHDPQ